MTRHYFIISGVILVVLSIFLSGCNISESEIDEDLLKPSEIFKDGMTIYFSEYTSEPDLRLMMKTKGEFDYSSIDFEVIDRDVNSKFTREIIIKGILRRPELPPQSIPITANAHLSFSKIEGEINLILRDGPFTDSFKVNITEEKVDVTPLDTTFTDILFDLYYRRPPNSLYYSCNTIETKKHLCEELHELLQDEANLREFHFPDDGKIPYPKQGAVWSFEYSAPVRYYLYDSRENFKHAGQLLTDFADENNVSNEDNWLYIVNWKEVAYSSYYMIF